MPISYVVLNGGNLVIERWRGEISHAEVLTHVQDLLQDTSVAKHAKVLTDTREAIFPETTLENVHEIVDLHKNPSNKTSISCCALLVTDEAWPKAKGLELVGDKYSLTFITFNSLDIACKWLGISTKETMEHIQNMGIYHNEYRRVSNTLNTDF